MGATQVADAKTARYAQNPSGHLYDVKWRQISPIEQEEVLERLEKEMLDAAKKLDFERAFVLRDEIKRLKQKRTRHG